MDNLNKSTVDTSAHFVAVWGRVNCCAASCGILREIVRGSCTVISRGAFYRPLGRVGELPPLSCGAALTARATKTKFEVCTQDAFINEGTLVFPFTHT